MNIQEARPYIFVGLSFALIIWEFFKPVYKRFYGHRFWHNYVFLLLGIFILKLAFPAGLAALTLKTPRLLWHLNQLPFSVEIPITIVLFDLAMYWQHRLSHKWRWFWQFHAIHHSDATLDFTSAARFHPGEIFFSGIYKLLLITLIGPSLEGYLSYEILLSSFALFNHSNIYISRNIDNLLRRVIVTPEMHYPHHSPEKALTNKNFGNIFSWWDKLFKTYSGDTNRVFGLNDFPPDKLGKLMGHPILFDYFKRK
ncbi:MAG: hypothetical protein CME65_05590 [Halobacteriovoraceae bacterium]|nr:hypothetical protein [Halobacteriovoraceae bacterium]|tara:strand:- start:1496 stop:2257 length:762 start_codon:yes stop_codon:yes gene_type:complete